MNTCRHLVPSRGEDNAALAILGTTKSRSNVEVDNLTGPGRFQNRILELGGGGD